MPKKRDMNAPYWQQLREAERRIIEYALEHGGSLRGTAAILGISSNFLSERARELGVPTPEVRPGPKPGTPRPALRVVPPDGEVPDTDDTDTPVTPKAPKPPRRPAASSDDTLDEDEEDEEDWEEGADDEDDEDDDGDAADDSDDGFDDSDDDDGDGDAEDASQSGN